MFVENFIGISNCMVYLLEYATRNLQKNGKKYNKILAR